MDIDADIRQIARETARDVFREHLEQLERALAQRTQAAALEPLLTVEEVAKLCNVATKTVQRWIAKGLLRAMRGIGMRGYRITRREYEAFVEGTRARTSVVPPDDSDDLDAQVSRAVAAAVSPSRGRR
jgi:excisionase family DNA binding protein